MTHPDLISACQVGNSQLHFDVHLSKVEIGAACYRTDKAQIPKSAEGERWGECPQKGTAGGTAGNSAVPLLFLTKLSSQHSSQQSPFPGTLPSTLPGTFGDLGSVSPVADCPELKSKVHDALAPKHPTYCNSRLLSKSFVHIFPSVLQLWHF